MSKEVEIPMPFPLTGVEISCEFGRQPPLTTPVGSNVRAFDTLAERGRGGSRPGMSKLIDGLVNGVSVIQHLTVLVDPTLPALELDDDPDGVLDPSTGARNYGRLVRSGGSGLQPNRNSPASTAPQFKQQKSVGHFGGDASPSARTLTLNLPVVANSQVFVVVQLPGGFSSAISSVADGQGNVYELVERIEPSFNPTANEWLALYRTKPLTDGSLTITVTFTGTPTVPASIIAAFEYLGLSRTSPVVDSNRAADNFLNFVGTVTAETPRIICTSNQNIVLAIYSAPLGTAGGAPVTSRTRVYDTVPAITPPAALPAEAIHGPATGDIFGSGRLLVSRLVTSDIVLTDGGVVMKLEWTFSAPTTGKWLAIGLSLKKA